MKRVYIVPHTQELGPLGLTWAPKYFRTLGARCGNAYLGLGDACIVVADVTNQQHNQVKNNPDLIALPANIDQQIGAALSKVQTDLESLNFPASWVNATHTYRRVLKIMLGVIFFSQHVRGREGVQKLFPSGVNLNTTFSQLPSAMRAKLKQAADSLGYDSSNMTGATTMRQIAKAVADQAPPFHIGGWVI